MDARRGPSRKLVVVVGLALALRGGASAQDLDCDPSEPPGDELGSIPPPTPFPRLDASALSRFVAGALEFGRTRTPGSGLGPVFNAASCVACHRAPAVGGSSAEFVLRFGTFGPRGFDPLAALGGSLIQAHGICTPACRVAGETIPVEATFVTRRDTPALFGLGLLDAIPDARILRLADPDDRDHDGISGRAHRLEDGRVGRFGWKAQIGTLREFAGAALLNEMGITNPDFPAEVPPHGAPVTCDPTDDPEDDGTAVSALTDFMTLLAPLPRAPRRSEAAAGKRVFGVLGCPACHTGRLHMGRQGTRRRPYSDLLLHDLGPGLADHIVQGDASGSEFRTAPLWGVAQSAPYLHDGRAATLAEAIAAHGGEADAARNTFITLGEADQQALVAFLDSL
jgi:CxxC motif-containing protein (DUF1111 family)